MGKRGETTEAKVDTPGVYEICNVDRKKGKIKEYALLISWNGELEEYGSDLEDAMKIASRLDAGEKFDDIVAGGEDGYTIRSKAEIRKEATQAAKEQQREAAEAAAAQAVATGYIGVETAAANCIATLMSLSPTDRKKAMKAIKDAIAPPKVKTAVQQQEEAPAEPEELDQDAISKILGSTMTRIKRPQFGGLGLPDVAAAVATENEAADPERIGGKERSAN